MTEHYSPHDDNPTQVEFDRPSLGGWLSRVFVANKITLILIVIAVLFGLFAVFTTPREENPQISVPAVNVVVPYPGASPEEVRNLVVEPLEGLIWQLEGIEDINSTALPGRGMVTARFEVGLPEDDSVFKVWDTIYSHLNEAPQGTMAPIVRPVDVDDVPVIGIALYSESRPATELRDVGGKVMDKLRAVRGTGAATLIGGRKQQINVNLDPLKLAEHRLNPDDIAQVVKSANLKLPASYFNRRTGREFLQAGSRLKNAKDVGSLVVGTENRKPVYLRDVAEVKDGAVERDRLTRVGFGPALELEKKHHEVPGSSEQLPRPGATRSAVFLGIAKKEGTNAVVVADELIAEMERVSGELLPEGVEWTLVRNDGRTADEAVNELFKHLGFAVVIVITLLVITLGWRDASVVTVAIPLTLLITLGIGLLFGQTINRITLFALILSLGLLVDDAIVVVENIHRHLQRRYCGPGEACVRGVHEISSPTVYATLAVVLSMVPMAFVTGMMGPYMGPIPFNVPVALSVSLLIAFVVSPYLAYRWIGVHRDRASDDGGDSEDDELSPPELEQTPIYRFYKRFLQPLFHSTAARRTFYTVLALLLLVVLTFPVFGWVKFRMLPKQDADKFLVQINMEQRATLAETDRVTRRVERLVAELREVTQFESYVGTGSMVDFNGLLRGTAFRDDVRYASVRVHLAHGGLREAKSEDVVFRLRPRLKEIQQDTDAVLKIVEDPPGPPVRSTIVAELYGDYGPQQEQTLGRIRDQLEQVPGVVDVDDSLRELAPETEVRVDRVKSSLSGVPPAVVADALRTMVAGKSAGTAQREDSEEQVPIQLRFPPEYRRDPAVLDSIKLTPPKNSPGGKQGPVPLSEVVIYSPESTERAIHHKNLQPVSYVTAAMGDRSSVYAVIDMLQWLRDNPLPEGMDLEWSGEWELTLEVFRDLGIAMGVAIVLIYLLFVARYRSFSLPAILIGSIPLTMLGIMPGFALLGNWKVYFSATGMIGVIALSGIVVRNSLLLIDFILDRKEEGYPIEKAVMEAAALRTRPILLTALATAAGMIVIVADPVWSGLAWSLVFGMFASTLLSLFVIPLLYYSVYCESWEREREEPQSEPAAGDVS